MKRFIEGQDRSRLTLLPECPEDYVGENNPVRVVEAFVDQLDLAALGFCGRGARTSTQTPSVIRSTTSRWAPPRGSWSS